MKPMRDEFLSEEDLDLANLDEEELVAYWNLWLLQAQATNELDDDTYSHGVFVKEPRAEEVSGTPRDRMPDRSVAQ